MTQRSSKSDKLAIPAGRSNAPAGALRYASRSAALVLAAPVPVLAQDPANLPGNEGTALTWAVFAGLLVIGCATGFIKSKRSHQH